MRWRSNRCEKKRPSFSPAGPPSTRLNWRLTLIDLELNAAVYGPRPIRFLTDGRLGFSKARRGHAVRFNALHSEFFHHGLRSAQTQRLVVVIAADVIGV